MNDRALKELQTIYKQDKGILKPKSVVEFAKNNKTTELHKCFNWNKDEAAYEHWLWQARQLIRVAIVVLPGVDVPVKAFVSLSTNREETGGGYTYIEDVMNDEEKRAQMIDDALRELEIFQRKYSHLAELSSVWNAVKAVERKVSRKRTKTEQSQRLTA